MKNHTVNNEDAAIYAVTDNREAEDDLIQQAISILRSRHERGETLDRPAASADYCNLMIGGLEHEIFGMISLDNRNRVIAFDELFRGTIDGSSVYPREVVKAALENNAAAVIFTHNHPSGVTQPSQADIRITDLLKKALGTIDIRVLDHIIVAHGSHQSLAEGGLI